MWDQGVCLVRVQGWTGLEEAVVPFPPRDAGLHGGVPRLVRLRVLDDVTWFSVCVMLWVWLCVRCDCVGFQGPQAWLTAYSYQTL